MSKSRYSREVKKLAGATQNQGADQLVGPYWLQGLVTGEFPGGWGKVTAVHDGRPGSLMVVQEGEHSRTTGTPTACCR